MNRLQNGFNHADLPGVWRKVIEVLMRYVTLEGRFRHFHAHLFPMLNQLRYNVKMKFSFWILSSLEKTIKNV